MKPYKAAFVYVSDDFPDVSRSSRRLLRRSSLGLKIRLSISLNRNASDNLNFSLSSQFLWLKVCKIRSITFRDWPGMWRLILPFLLLCNGITCSRRALISSLFSMSSHVVSYGILIAQFFYAPAYIFHRLKTRSQAEFNQSACYFEVVFRKKRISYLDKYIQGIRVFSVDIKTTTDDTFSI